MNTRSQAELELIKEFKTFDLTRKSSSEVVKPSKLKPTSIANAVSAKKPPGAPKKNATKTKRPPPPPPFPSNEMPDIVKTSSLLKVILTENMYCFMIDVMIMKVDSFLYLFSLKQAHAQKRILMIKDI